MHTALDTLLTNPFLYIALLAGLAASVIGGVIGSYVVVKRISFISGSISHAVLSGLGIAFWLQYRYQLSAFSPILGALCSAILAAIGIGIIHYKYREREDSLIAAMWSLGMAIGVIFISKTPGFNTELMNFLFGNILWVTQEELYLLGLLDIGIITLVCLFYRQFLVICFDEDQAALQGLWVPGYYLLLLILIAISILFLVQIVGTTLVITMLTIPATIANTFTRRLSRMMCLAVLLNMIFCVLGTGLAFYLNWPPGATIALVSGSGYLVSLCK